MSIYTSTTFLYTKPQVFCRHTSKDTPPVHLSHSARKTRLENLALSLCPFFYLFILLKAEFGYFPMSHAVQCVSLFDKLIVKWNQAAECSLVTYLQGLGEHRLLPRWRSRRECQGGCASRWAFIPGLFLAVISRDAQGQSAPEACKKLCSGPNFILSNLTGRSQTTVNFLL